MTISVRLLCSSDMCRLCKGTMKESTTTHTVDLGKCLIVVRNVPCLECTQCGEMEYTTEVVKRLEQIVQSCREMMTEIMIISYTEKVA